MRRFSACPAQGRQIPRTANSASPREPVVDSTAAAPVTCSKPKAATFDYSGAIFGTWVPGPQSDKRIGQLVETAGTWFHVKTRSKGGNKMAKGVIGAAQLKQYQEQGFVLVKGMFDAQEIGVLHRAAKEDKALDDHGYGKADGEGGVVRLALWNHPGDTIYGMFARCESVVRSCESRSEERRVGKE